MAEKRLYDAAVEGDEKALDELLQEDPLLLNRVSYTSPNKTPLHVATTHRHLPFVEQILNQNPLLAEELDSQQSSALHLASAKCYVEIVTKLLSAAPDMCMSRDSQRRNPLHLAAIKGHVRVLEELFREAPFAAREKVDGGLSLLHLCVKYSQFEALNVLVPLMNRELLNWKDDDGDTILHMAVRDKQIEAINFLLTVAELEVDTVNRNEMTALDVLIQSRWDSRDLAIKKSLKRAGAARRRSLQNQDKWLKEKKSALMVVAILIATMAFQAGVNPPGGVWQEDKAGDPQEDQFITDLTNQTHLAGYSVMARNYPYGYKRFYILNTISFIASLSIILLLMSEVPLRGRFFMGILMVATWLSTITIAYSYLVSTSSLIPDNTYVLLWRAISNFVIGWSVLMALLFIVHAILLIRKLIRKLRKKRMTRQRWMVAVSAVPAQTVGV